MYKFQSLPQLEDHRNTIHKHPTKVYHKRRNQDKRTWTRSWHHSATRKMQRGSVASGFARYHVNHLDWPGIGYHFIIEPQNIVDTPRGPRARIVYANDIDRRSFHVGNSNDFCIGICVAGDYRFDKVDEASMASMVELQQALVDDNFGKDDRSHHEHPGYQFKLCCSYDYEKKLKFLPTPPANREQLVGETYTVQEGDTLWGLANAHDEFTAEDLMAWNNITDPTKLATGQVIFIQSPKIKDIKAPITYTIKPGDTLSGIASRFKVTVKQLQDWNGIKDPNVIPAGWVLVIEDPKESPSEPVRKPLYTGILQQDMNVRKGAGLDNPIATTMNKGDEVTVFEEVTNGRFTWLDIGSGEFISNTGGKYVQKKGAAYKHAGKRVIAIAARVNFYDTPRWTNPSGHFTRNQGWTIIDHLDTGGAGHYKVKNSRGKIYYITARKDLVRIV